MSPWQSKTDRNIVFRSHTDPAVRRNQLHQSLDSPIRIPGPGDGRPAPAGLLTQSAFHPADRRIRSAVHPFVADRTTAGRHSRTYFQPYPSNPYFGKQSFLGKQLGNRGSSHHSAGPADGSNPGLCHHTGPPDRRGPREFPAQDQNGLQQNSNRVPIPDHDSFAGLHADHVPARST